MAKSSSADKKWKHAEAALRLTWDSLESHLPYTHGKHSDGRKFHRKTVREYVQLMKHIVETLK